MKIQTEKRKVNVEVRNWLEEYKCYGAEYSEEIINKAGLFDANKKEYFIMTENELCKLINLLDDIATEDRSMKLDIRFEYVNANEA